MIVGLTGGIGSGKTTVLNEFKKQKEVAVYIADAEAKILMNTSLEIKERLIALFGEQTYKGAQLNREYLSNIVFNNPEKLELLNKIVHPAVENHFQNFCKNNKDKAYIVYESAILFESGNDTKFDKIIIVTAPLHLRIQRVVDRDKVTEEAVRLRINNQWADGKKTIQSHYIIVNTNLPETKLKVLEIHQKLTRLQLLQ